MAILAVSVAVGLAGLAYDAAGACAKWQDRYKQWIYSETQKNSPLIVPEGGVEAIIGAKPSGCGGPPYELTHADMERYRQQGIGPDTFAEEIRAAYLRSRS